MRGPALLAVAVSICLPVATAVADPGVARVRAVQTVREAPIRFEPNEPGTAFVARTPAYTVDVGRDAFGIRPRGTPDDGVTVRLVGANPNARVVGDRELPGRMHYYRGDDPSRWRTDVPGFARAIVEQAYRGVDLVLYGNGREVEFDLVVAAGVDPSTIELAIERAAAPPHTDADGNLVIPTAGAPIQLRTPVVYQTIGDAKRPVPARYVLRGDDRVAFELGPRDGTAAVVIDPVIAYSTYLGTGAYDTVLGLAVDAEGHPYVLGTVPTAATYSEDVFVVKLRPDGSAIDYGVVFGGTGDDKGFSIAVDSAGSVYVAGTTHSNDFPTTSDAFQPRPRRTSVVFGAGFVTKLSPRGDRLVYSTYLSGGPSPAPGGSVYDGATGIAVDAEGFAYVVGHTVSPTFPTTPGAFQREIRGVEDTFVLKLSRPGSRLVYSTLLGGTGNDSGRAIAIDGLGHAYVAGTTYRSGARNDFPTTPGAFQASVPAESSDDGFVTKLAPDGSGLVYSTYLSGSDMDILLAIAIDAEGRAHVGGMSKSADYPTRRRLQWPSSWIGTTGDAIVTKLTPDGSGLVYSTHLGGRSWDDVYGIVVDRGGNAWITGLTTGPWFPTTPDAWQPRQTASNHDAFVMRLSPLGALLFSSYHGGWANDWGTAIALDAGRNVYVAGMTASVDFPIVSPLQGAHAGGVPHYDGFLAKITPPATRADLQVDGIRRLDGERLVYTFAVKNAGPDDLPNVQLDQRLSYYADVLEIMPGTATCEHLDAAFLDPSRIYCELGPLGNGASAKVSVAVRWPVTVTPFENVAIAAAPGNRDPDVSNNRVTVSPAGGHTLVVHREGPGHVDNEYHDIECGTHCTARFFFGARVTLTATPDDGAVFVGWGGACRGRGTCTVVMDERVVVSATFRRR